MTSGSEGLPAPGSGSTNGIETGSLYHFPNVVIIGSRIAGGCNLVETLTSCFRLGERFKIALILSLYMSPQIRNWTFEPYFEGL